MKNLLGFIGVLFSMMLLLTGGIVAIARQNTDGNDIYFMIDTYQDPCYLMPYVEEFPCFPNLPPEGIGQHLTFQWLPDGSGIYYTFTAHNFLQLYFTSIRGKTWKLLADNIIYEWPRSKPDIKFSNDRKWVFYIARQNEQDVINKMRPDGSERQILAPDFMPYIKGVFPSPDMDWIYAHGCQQLENDCYLFRFHPDGSSPEIVTLLRDIYTHNWQFSPDKQWLSFGARSTFTSDTGELSLCIAYCTIHLETGQVYSSGFLAVPSTFPFDILWTVDSQWLITMIEKRSPETDFLENEIIRTHPDGSAKQILTDARGIPGLFLLSPDSEWAFYSHGTNEQGNFDLYRIRIDGTEKSIIFRDLGLAKVLFCQKNNQLYVVQLIEEDYILYRISPDGSEKQPVFTLCPDCYFNDIFLTPDGQWLLVSYYNSADSFDYRFMLNVDTDEIKELPFSVYEFKPEFSPPLDEMFE